MFHASESEIATIYFGSINPTGATKHFRESPVQQAIGVLILRGRSERDFVLTGEMGKSLAEHLSDAKPKSGDQTFAQAIFGQRGGVCLNHHFLQANHGRSPSVALGQWFEENDVTVYEHPEPHGERNPLLNGHHPRLANELERSFEDARRERSQPDQADAARIQAIRQAIATARAALRAAAGSDDHRRTVSIKLPREFALFSKEELELIITLIRQIGIQNRMNIKVVNRTEGCTNITFEMSDGDLTNLLDAIDAGKLDSLLPHGVTVETSRKTGFFAPDPVDLTSLTPGLVDRFWRQTARREWLIGPWRRLLCLISPSILFSSLRDVIANTNERFFAADKTPDQWRCLRDDLRGAFLFWPVLTSVLVFALSSILNLLGVPVNIPFGVFTGLALALVGSLPCSYVISPLACGAGAVFIGTAFGVANSLACGAAGGLSALPQVMESAPRFNLIVGGIFGTTVKFWKPLSPAVVFAVLTLTAGGIALAAWLMGQPYVAAGEERRSVSRRILGVLEGAFLGGIGIGMIFGLTALLSTVLPMDWSVSIPTAVIGSAAMAASVWLRTGKPKKSIAYAGLQFAIIGSLLAIMFGASNGSFRVLSNAMLTGYFHATFFTLAFIIGARRGGAQAGVWAAILEGVGGYLGFIISQLLTT